MISFSSLAQHRELVWEMAMRDLRGINQGAFLGYFWLVLSPFVQVAAYVIIVTFVFRRSLGADSGPFDYAVYILSGMVPWQIITRSLQVAPSLIRERVELVKQVIFPIETLPLIGLITGSVGAIVSLLVFLILQLFAGKLTIGYLLLPLPVVFLVMFVLGLSWTFSIVGVVFKDLREIVTVLLGLMVYLSPVAVNESIAGERLWQFITLNPLAHIIIAFRDIFNGEFHPVSWIVFICLAIISFLLGGWVINRAKILINEYI